MSCVIQWGFIRKPQPLDAYDLEWTYVLRNSHANEWIVQLSATYREPVDAFGGGIYDEELALNASVKFAEDRLFYFDGDVQTYKKDRAFGRKSLVLKQKLRVLGEGPPLLKGRAAWEVKYANENIDIVTTPFSIEFLSLPPLRPFFKLS